MNDHYRRVSDVTTQIKYDYINQINIQVYSQKKIKNMYIIKIQIQRLENK